jgi:hypothetical protein
MNNAFGTGCTQAAAIPPSEEGFAELEKSAKKMQGCGKQILLSFTGDPYCDMEPACTRRVLEILNHYGHKVAILTKGGMRVLQDLPLFRQFGDRLKAGATLTFDTDEASLEWEPGAALPSERLESLRILSENRIRTWASFEPVVYPEHSLRLLQKAGPFVDHVKIGKLNNYRGLDGKVDWNGFIRKSVQVCRDYDLKFYIKDDLAPFNRDTYLFPEERSADRLSL